MDSERLRIVAEYRQADMARRLDMFMRYRDLRRDFSKIDHLGEPGFERHGIVPARLTARFSELFKRLAPGL